MSLCAMRLLHYLLFFFPALHAAAATPAPEPAPEAVTSTSSPAEAGTHLPTRVELSRYPWLSKTAPVRTLEAAIAPPPGFTRVPLEPGSFSAWLRDLPLRPAGTPVRDFQGTEIVAGDDPFVAAVVELDVSPAGVQQCADSIIRLHAEWLWSQNRKDRIAYSFTSGHLARWTEYAAGDRPEVSGTKVSWVHTGTQARSRAAFRAYLDMVFTYAGTHSLASEKNRPAREDIQPGDFFVEGGNPGHAVLVLDVAVNAAGERVALLGQGSIPAQDFHIFTPGQGDPWFSLEADELVTPVWTPFPWSSLRRL
jgi:uncharacterized protein DUF4846